MVFTLPVLTPILPGEKGSEWLCGAELRLGLNHHNVKLHKHVLKTWSRSLSIIPREAGLYLQKYLLCDWLGAFLCSQSSSDSLSCLGSTSHQVESVSPASASQLEVSLVNPDLPRLPCDVSPLHLDLPTIRCRTRYGPDYTVGDALPFVKQDPHFPSVPHRQFGSWKNSYSC